MLTKEQFLRNLEDLKSMAVRENLGHVTIDVLDLKYSAGVSVTFKLNDKLIDRREISVTPNLDREWSDTYDSVEAYITGYLDALYSVKTGQHTFGEN